MGRRVKMPPTFTQKALLKVLNAFVEPKLLPECAIQKKACPVALTPPTHLRTLDKMMQRMTRAFKALDIEHVACAGTALGAVRHNGFIPWDDDADYFVTRAAFKKVLQKDVRKTLLQKYKLGVERRYEVFGVLKLVLPGKSSSNSPFIDLFTTQERRSRSRGKNYLAADFITMISLYLLNPVGTTSSSDRLYEGTDYKRDKDGVIRFITKPFPWYTRTIDLPASGVRYVTRTFGGKSLSHAVLRIYVPAANKQHKFRDIAGVYKLHGSLRPTFGAGGVVSAPGAAGDIRTHAQFKRDPDNPRFFRYWGQERSVVLRK